MGAALWYHNVGISQWEYPDLAEAFARADVPERRAMCLAAQGMRSRREILSLSLAERDRFLQAGGYCTSLPSSRGCKSVPHGHEAIGMVIDEFPSGEYGPSCGDLLRASG